jgi:hypothetical protein
MSEWWTYTLADFLLFAPKTYYRLFELYNRDVWPGQLVGLVFGGAILLALLADGNRAHGRQIAAILAACWAWVAGAFLYERYATINWAAIYFAGAFALEALLLVVTGVIRGRLAVAPVRSFAVRAGILLLAFALVGEPSLGVLAGRQWVEAEIFGLAPDPTVVGTLGVLLCGTGRNFHLLIVPLLWCATSGAFLLAMEAPDAPVLPAAGIAAVFLSLRKRATDPVA